MYQPLLKFKSAKISFFATMFSIMLFLSSTQAQTYDFPKLIDKIAEETYSSRGHRSKSFEDVSIVDGWVSNQNNDGSWDNSSSYDDHLWRL
jgi:hypothetical protein